MIEVIFVVHARGKIRTGSGTLDALPEAGQMITVRGQEYKVLKTRTTATGSLNRLPKPEVDVEPLR